MLNKILGGGLALSLVASAVLYKLWEKSQSDLAVLKANVEIYKSINEDNKKSIERLTNLAESNAESLASLGQQNETISKLSLSHQTEVNNLRASEAKNALEMPFERGNASHQRIVSQLMRFTGDSSSKNDTGNDKTINTGGSSPAKIK